ncbi:MAG: hypothetical protein ACT4QD_15660 [Acidobacteriota bacterium]
MIESDRRHAVRCATPGGGHPLSTLRPGQRVKVVNLGAGGALLESFERLAPGARADLVLRGATTRQVRGRLTRCRVVCLTPVRYQAAMMFDEPLPLD